MSRQRATASAPASVGNVGVGYDLLGHVIVGPADRVTARRANAPGVEIESVTGVVTDLPRDSLANTAGTAAAALLKHAQADFGVALSLDKGIPLSSGLGGSAASATAAVVAVNALLDRPLERIDLYPFALAGEAVASGSVHGDNVGPQLAGGLVLTTRDRIIDLPVPDGLHAAVAHPDCRLETRAARAVLDRQWGIDEIVAHHTRLALVLAGCYRGDFDLIAEGLDDGLVEPCRAGLIPGFAEVKQAALASGALGASISGAGPSVFAWCRNREAAESAGEAMAEAFARHDLATTIHISPVAAPGATLIDSD